MFEASVRVCHSTQHSCCHMEAATDSVGAQEHSCVPAELYLENQWGSRCQLQLASLTQQHHWTSRQMLLLPCKEPMSWTQKSSPPWTACGLCGAVPHSAIHSITQPGSLEFTGFKSESVNVSAGTWESVDWILCFLHYGFSF